MNAATDLTTAAVCGLYCEACTLYIATFEDPKRLKDLAQRFGVSEAEVRCLGCRSDKRGPYCKICKMFDCAARQDLRFCGECAQYPCADLRQFQSELPHRLELWQDLERIRDSGVMAWRTHAKANHSCPDCGTINSAYDLDCRHCGRSPSCPFVERHRQAIEAVLRTF